MERKMRTAVRAGLLLSGSVLASLGPSTWSQAQTDLPEVKVTAPEETAPKPAPKKTAARKPVAQPAAAPRRVAAPVAAPPPSPEQIAAQAAQNVIRENRSLDQKLLTKITPALGATTYEITRDT